MSLWHKIKGRNVPANQPAALNLASYITPKQLAELWAPFEVPAYFYPSTFFLYKWHDIAKTSAFHVREGNAYEGKAVLAHNPYKVFDIDDLQTYGHLNALSDGELRVLEKENKDNIEFLAAFGKGKDAQKERKVYLDKNPHVKPYNMEFIKAGRKTLAKMMKYGGHFNKAHLSSYELKKYLKNKWELGKGVDYIDPDYTIIEPPKVRNGKAKRGKIIFVEFKKGSGKTNTSKDPAEAQQLRKAATLAVRWGLIYWNQIPKIELYFVGGRAGQPSELEFTRNRGTAINRRTPAQIEANWPRNARGEFNKKPTWIGWPIRLLTGRGLADMLHMPPTVVARLTTDQTRAYVLDTPRLVDLIDNEYGISTEKRKINLSEFTAFKEAVATNTPQWAYDPVKMGSSANFNKEVRKVAKLLGYIKAHRLDLKSPSRNTSQNMTKKTKILDTIKLLLAKYSNYVDPAYLEKLRKINANYRAGASGGPRARSTGGNVKTPNMGEAFMSPILRRRGQFKVEKGKKLRVGNLPTRSRALAKYPTVQNIINEASWKAGPGQRGASVHIKVKQGNIQIANKERLNRIVKSLANDIQNAYARKDKKRFDKSRAALRRIIETRQANLPANFTPQIRNFFLENRPFNNAGGSSAPRGGSAPRAASSSAASPIDPRHPWPPQAMSLAKAIKAGRMSIEAAKRIVNGNANLGPSIKLHHTKRPPWVKAFMEWVQTPAARRPEPIPE